MQCRNENRNHGNEEQQTCHFCECQRVKRRNVKEQAAKRARHEGRGNQPHRRASNHHAHPVAHDKAENACTRGAEGHAHTDFARSPLDRVRDDAIDTERRQQQGGKPETIEKQRALPGSCLRTESSG